MKTFKKVVALGALATGALWATGCAHSADMEKTDTRAVTSPPMTGGTGGSGMMDATPYAPPGSAAPRSVSAPGGGNYGTVAAPRPAPSPPPPPPPSSGDNQAPTDGWRSTGVNDSVTDSNTGDSLDDSAAVPGNTPDRQPVKSAPSRPEATDVSDPSAVP